MSYAVPPVASLSEAWLRALEFSVNQFKGRTVHLLITVTQPGLETAKTRHCIDAVLNHANMPSVDTVAQTVFPWELYEDPGVSWKSDLDADIEERIDRAAHELYERYLSMLPIVLTDPANRRGTYFSRMISWPGKGADGTNQLSTRIAALRHEHNSRRFTNNTIDIDLSADCYANDSYATGTQIYAVTDQRNRGFPCLVHLSFTLLNGVLHCTAVYRHHYLMTKAYGNLVGLSYLMKFLCQQTGFELGELVVNATLADSEPSLNPKRLIRELRQPSLIDTNGALT